MKKYTIDNGKIIRSMIASMSRLTQEVHKDLVTDENLPEGQIWHYKNAGDTRIFFYNKQALQSINRVRTKISGQAEGFTLAFGFLPADTQAISESGSIWILWDEFSFDVQANLAIYLTEIFK